MQYSVHKLTSITIILLFMFMCGYSHASGMVPADIRIGLFFNYSQRGINTAVDSFDVASENGVIVGTVKNGKYAELFRQSSNASITVQKDIYIATTDAFYLRINGAGVSKGAAESRIKWLNSKGIEAKLAYVDGWQVWTGPYGSVDAAKADLENRISKKVKLNESQIINPSKTRVAVIKKGENAVMFDGCSDSFLRIYPVKGQLKINNSPTKIYRGRLEIRRTDKSDMTVINILPFEQYLYGVVPNEIGGASPKEAVKAQAVAARTFAVSQLKQYNSLGFDLCTTPFTQVYRGFSSEYPASNKAVDETKGIVVTYQGKIAPVFYSSSDGGATEDVKNVWGSEVPYLKSVKDVYESGKSINYNWSVTLSTYEIKDIMNKKGYDLGDILSLDITKTSSTTRVTELVISGTKGKKTYINEGARTVFSLNSQLYTITTSKDPLKFTFVGKGWGHAVGMSQDGAIGMAKAGYTYEEILKHYLTGVKIGR